MDQRYRYGRITLPRVRRHAAYLIRHALAPPGRMPDVLIVGAMKGGTTSLFSYLNQHPQVHGSLRKEVHYFDRHFRRGSRWYRKHFTQCADGVVVEATPDYMFHATSFERIARVLPRAKLIMLLRDPVRRAYSHYHHSRTKGTESRPFVDAVYSDLRWYRAHGVLGDDRWQSNDHSYVRRGIYAPQVRRILNVYGDALLVLRSEDLFADPLAVTNRTLRFVGLSPLDVLSDVDSKTAGNYDRVVPMHRELDAFYRPHSEELYELLGVDAWWPASSAETDTSVAAAA